MVVDLTLALLAFFAIVVGVLGFATARIILVAVLVASPVAMGSAQLPKDPGLGDSFDTNTAPALSGRVEQSDPVRCFDHALRDEQNALQAYQVVYGSNWQSDFACQGRAAPELQPCWALLLQARPLIEQAARTYEEARHVMDPASGQMIKQGNALMRQAGDLWLQARACFAPIFAKWTQNGGHYVAAAGVSTDAPPNAQPNPGQRSGGPRPPLNGGVTASGNPCLPFGPGGYDYCNNPAGTRLPAGCVCPRQPPHVGVTKSATRSIAVTTMQEIAKRVFNLYDSKGKPIEIIRASQRNGFSRPTYVMFLAGTEFNWAQSNSALTDVSTAMHKVSSYDIDILRAVRTAIPSGSDIIIAGHSLGGMAAQVFAQNLAIYPGWSSGSRVVRIITFGSPETTLPLPNVIYDRYAVKDDLVPFLPIPGVPEGHQHLVDNGLQIQIPSVLQIQIPSALVAHLSYGDNESLKLIDPYGKTDRYKPLFLDEWTARSFSAPNLHRIRSAVPGTVPPLPFSSFPH